MTITDLINYILSPGLQERLLSLKVIFIFIGLVFLIGIIIFSIKTTYLRAKYWQKWAEISHFKPYGTQKAGKTWQRIKKRLDKDQVPEAKLAILGADKMVDNILKRMGYRGENLDERLEGLDTNIIPSLDLLKDNHRISNNIKEDPQYYLNLKDAKRIIDNYEKILKELQVF